MAGVKRGGLGDETRRLRWMTFLIICGAAVVATGPEALRIVGEWLNVSQESLPWYTSRALGFLGYWTLTISVIYGLLLSTGLLDSIANRAVSLTLHQDLSAISIALVALHGVVLTLDKFVDTPFIQVLVPFSTSFEPLWVGIGQLAFYVMVGVYASFYARKRLGQRGWRLIHYSTFFAFLGATAHGLMAGTDTSAPWALWSYAGSLAIVFFLLGYRIVLSVGKSATRRHPVAPVTVREE